MKRLVLLRHGESMWNQANRFTGWTDVDLSTRGIDEARRAGRLLAEEGFAFDEAHTSFLRRAIRTLWLVQETLDEMWIPTYATWRLNERHYGALQGLDKAETAAKFGEEQVRQWRRSYAVAPPALDPADSRYSADDPRYQAIGKPVPRTESLKDTLQRLLPYWKTVLAPAIKADKRVLVVAHGSSLRALVKHLDHVSDEAIADLDIPTGIPLVYELDDRLRPRSHAYLGDPTAVEAAVEAVANQGRAAPATLAERTNTPPSK